jgi:alanyl-tRNA synthetase
MNDQAETSSLPETQRLFFDDAYRREFEAAVVERSAHEGKPAVVLDQTCFYPESGGQPADTGTLDGARVVDVYEDGPRIVHVLDRETSGSGVGVAIDWERRFDHMQQHTGQHILSQCFVECLAGETMSFHLGADVATLEIGLRAAAETDLAKVEDRANAVILENREVKTYFVPEDRIGSVPLRRPPKKTGLIRVVEVSGFDYSACGGTHCRRTGEVGLIKIIRTDRIRTNLRLEFLCGGRALRDYAWKNRLLADLAGRLSVQARDAAGAVVKLAAEAKDMGKKLRRLREEMAVYEARDLTIQARGPIVRGALPDKTAEEAKLLALNIIRAGEFAALFGVTGADRIHLIFAASEKLGLNMRELVPVIQALAPAKGGGSPSLVELVVDKGADIEAVLAGAAEYLKKKLSS